LLEIMLVLLLGLACFTLVLACFMLAVIKKVSFYNEIFINVILESFRVRK
jgi:hypothetical protein